MHRPGSTTRARVVVVEPDRVRTREDALVTEEPLEVRVAAEGSVAVPFTVTMRTPGHDMELAAGLLHAEGVLPGRAGLRRIAYCTDRALSEEQRYNVVTVELAGRAPVALLDRARPMTTSACGVCGAASIDAVTPPDTTPLPPGPELPADLVTRLPGLLRERQRGFDRTGGSHGAALVSVDGEVLVAREDVGRHNAVDKVVGWALLQGLLPGPAAALVVSGRAGFEIVAKAVTARVPVVVSVSAPTSLSVDLARRTGATLVGFAREGRFTVYSGSQRVSGLVAPAAPGSAAAGTTATAGP